MALKKLLYKIKKKLTRSLDREERDFVKIYPLINQIEGFLKSPHQEKWFFKAARNAPSDATIVEIGSFKGRSTVSFGFGCKGTRRHIYAIDLFEGDGADYGSGDFLKIFNDNIEKCGLAEYVTAVQKHSLEVAREWNKPIDILFIDGSHEYDDVKADFNAFYPHVKKGGIIAFHDIKGKWDGVIRYWEEVKDVYLYNVGTVSSLGFGQKK